MNTKNKIPSGDRIRMWWFALSMALICGITEDTPALLELLLTVNMIVSGISAISTETMKRWNREDKI
jgi:hypothetical protein